MLSVMAKSKAPYSSLAYSHSSLGDGDVWRVLLLVGGRGCVRGRATAGRRSAEEIAGGCTENAFDIVGETASTSRESGRFFVIFIFKCKVQGLQGCKVQAKLPTLFLINKEILRLKAIVCIERRK